MGDTKQDYAYDDDVDANGQYEVEYDENGNEIEYDEDGNIIEYDEDGNVIEYEYDENGNVVEYDEDGNVIVYGDDDDNKEEYDGDYDAVYDEELIENNGNDETIHSPIEKE